MLNVYIIIVSYYILGGIGLMYFYLYQNKQKNISIKDL